MNNYNNIVNDFINEVKIIDDELCNCEISSNCISHDSFNQDEQNILHDNINSENNHLYEKSENSKEIKILKKKTKRNTKLKNTKLKNTKKNVYDLDNENYNIESINILDDIYNKLNKEDINNDNIIIKNNKLKDADDLKKICVEINDKVVSLSVRGYNTTKNLDILNLDLVNINLLDLKLDDNYNVSYLYRNYNNSNTYKSVELNEYWIEISVKNNKVITSNINKNDIFLKAYLKNFQTNEKFRKKINNIHIRAFKKKVQLYNKNLIIDIIFVVKKTIND